jgi:hypothetical protein
VKGVWGVAEDNPISIEIVDDSDVLELSGLCRACRGTGLGAEALALYDSFGGQDGWGHHLEQDEVNALASAGRLWEFTHEYIEGSAAEWRWKEPRYIPTAAEINAWSWNGFGHDLVNRTLCVQLRALKNRVYTLCDSCGGDGEVFQ